MTKLDDHSRCIVQGLFSNGIGGRKKWDAWCGGHGWCSNISIAETMSLATARGFARRIFDTTPNMLGVTITFIDQDGVPKENTQ